MKQICLVIIFAVAAGCAHLQPRQTVSLDHRYPVSSLIADFELLRGALEEAHPGLYDFCPKTEMNAEFDRIRAELTHDMTELEFLRLIAPLNGKIGCGHTAILPSIGARKQLFSTTGLFPCDVRIVGGRMFLLRCYAPQHEHLAGREIRTINGMSTEELIARFLEVLPRDGRNVTHQYQLIDEHMRYFFAAFIRISEQFEMSVKDANGNTERVTLPAMAESALRTHHAFIEMDSNDRDPLEFQHLEGSSTAVLTIRSFEESDRYMPFLEESFKQIRDGGIQNLIIDLRGNGGGEDEYGAALASYLLDKPFRYYSKLVTRTDRISFQAYTDATRAYERELKSILVKGENGWFDVAPEHHTCLSEIKPAAHVFLGRVLVLIDGGSFSATSEVASILHHHRRVEFIGEETGGGYYGNNSGFMPTLTLPETQIRAIIPLVQYKTAVEGYPFVDRGIIPDHVVEPSFDDEITGADKVMEVALALLESAQMDRPK